MKGLYVANDPDAPAKPKRAIKPVTFSRYHVAMFMEARYGRGLPWREIADRCGISTWGVRSAIRRAEKGEQFPEVTKRYVKFDWMAVN